MISVSEKAKVSAGYVFRLARKIVDDTYPGSILEFPMFDFPGSTALGFGVSYKGGLTFLFADVTDENWSLQIVCGVAIDIPDVAGARLWVNEKNRTLLTGRYCYAGNDHIAAVVYETSLWGGLFDAYFENYEHEKTSRLGGWLVNNVRSCIESYAQECHDVLQVCGGNSFPPDEHGLGKLFAISG